MYQILLHPTIVVLMHDQKTQTYIKPLQRLYQALSALVVNFLVRDRSFDMGKSGRVRSREDCYGVAIGGDRCTQDLSRNI